MATNKVEVRQVEAERSLEGGRIWARVNGAVIEAPDEETLLAMVREVEAPTWRRQQRNAA